MCTCEFLTCGRGAAGSDPGWCCRRWRLESGWRCIHPPPPLLFLLSETVAAVVGLPWFPKVWKPWQHTHTIAFSLTHTRLSGGVRSKGFHFSWDQMVSCKSLGRPGPYSVADPPHGSATGIESLHASPQSKYTSSHNTPEEKRYEIQDKGRCEQWQRHIIKTHNQRRGWRWYVPLSRVLAPRSYTKPW